MNAYWVDAGWNRVRVDYIAGAGVYEDTFLCEIVYAPTRGKARAMFCDAQHGEIEWRDIKHVRCLKKGCDGPARVAEHDDPLWASPLIPGTDGEGGNSSCPT